MRQRELKLSKKFLTLCAVLTLAACGGGNPADAPMASPTASSVQLPVSASMKKGGTDAPTQNPETVMDPQEQIHIVFSAKLSDKQGLDDYIAQMYDPTSSNFHKTLTPEYIHDRFGPTNGQINKLTAFMQAKGFKNVKVSDNRLVVEADVASSVAESLFATTLKKFILADGTTGHVNQAKPSMPSEIADLVTAVHGLDTVTRFQTHSKTAPTAGQFSTAATPPGTVAGHNPLDYPRIYNVGSTSTASNMTVGIITWGDPTSSVNDLHIFEQQNALPTTSTSITVVGTPSTDTREATEWSLDSQAVVAMSGGVKQLKFYTANNSNFANVLVAINASIQDPNRPQVINMSFGICDTSGGLSWDSSYFAVGVAQGQTFVASSGDFGSTCGGVANKTSYPASSRYVVNVGGTTLGTTGSTTYAGETAWSGSGGGDSKYTTIPFWQAIVPALAGNQYRSGPDVSFVGDNASGANIVVNGTTFPVPVGGTSLSAPLFAATWARLLQTCGTNLGFAAPTLYQYAKGNPNMYHDVTVGSNGGYSAGAGWDKVTGWGSINVDNMRAVICPGAAFFAGTEALYMAYLGRPTEPAGMAFWSSQMKNGNVPTTLTAFVNSYGSDPTVTSLVNSLANSPESQAFYTTSNVNTFVTQIYNVLFNRVPASSEISFWAGRINSGATPKQLAPLAIMNSALTSATTDTFIAGNKFAVAMNFTSTLTSTQSAYYSGATALASARHLLQNVSYTNNDGIESSVFWKQPAYVSRYQSSVNAAIAAIVAGTPY